MPTRIRTGISREKLVTSLPPQYGKMLPASTLGSGPFAVLLFPHDRDDVVTSPAVARALQRISEKPDTVVAVGGAFTVEAVALLASRNAIVLQTSPFAWTDADR